MRTSAFLFACLAPTMTLAAPAYVARIAVPVPDARFAATADLDGDLAADVVAISETSSEVLVFYNRGDGTLVLPPERYPTDAQPASVAVGDLTDDGVTTLPDILIVTRAGTVPSQMLVRGDLTILHNSGAPPGSVPPRFSTACPDLFLDGTGMTNGNQPAFAVLDYVDADALLDIVATSEFGNSIQSLFQGQTRTGCVANSICGFGFPDGATCAPVSTGLVNPRAAAVGRFIPNVHASADAVSLNLSSGRVSYHLHLNPNRDKFLTLAAQTVVVGGTTPVMMIADRLDADTLPDLLVANQGSNNVSVARALNASNLSAPVFEGNPTDPMMRPTRQYPANAGPTWVALGEFDLGPLEPPGTTPEFRDIVVSNASIDRVSVLPGVGDSSYLNPLCYGAGDDPRTVAVADLSVDGEPDVVVTNHGIGVSVLLGRSGANGGFDLAYRRATAGSVATLAGGDFTGDGESDVVVGHDDTNDLAVLRGLGDGRFEEVSRTSQLPGAPVALAVATIDGDAVADVVSLTSAPGEIRVFLGLANGVLSLGSTRAVAAGATDLVALPLATAPGSPTDLVLASPVTSELVVLRGDGSGIFAATPIAAPASGSPARLVWGDFNATAGLDVVALDLVAASVQLFANDGSGGLVGASPIPTGLTAANGIAAGDLTGDSQLDLLVTHDNGGLVVLIGDGLGGFTAQPPLSLPDATAPAAIVAPVIARLDGTSASSALVLIPSADAALVIPWDAGLSALSLTDAVGYGTGIAPRAAIAGSFDTSALNLDTIVIADSSDLPDPWTITVLSGRRWEAYPPADAGPDRAFCQGSAAAVTLGTPGKPFLQYSWSPASVSDPAVAQPTTMTAGTYTLTVTSPDTGLISTDTVVVSAESTPVVDIRPNPAAICTGATALVLDAGAGYADYQWSTGDSGRWLPVSPTAPTDYTVTVTTAGGCSAMGTRTVVVGGGVNLVATVEPATRCQASPTTFSADASASTVPAPGTLSFAWSIVEPTTDWLIVAPTSATTMINAAAPFSPRVVTLRLTVTSNPSGCVSTRDFRLEVAAPASIADLGNALRGVRPATPLPDDVVLQWSDAGAANYEVFGVDFKNDIPNIFTGAPIATTATTSSALNETGPRFYQVRGTCP